MHLLYSAIVKFPFIGCNVDYCLATTLVALLHTYKCCINNYNPINPSNNASYTTLLIILILYYITSSAKKPSRLCCDTRKGNESSGRRLSLELASSSSPSSSIAIDCCSRPHLTSSPSCQVAPISHPPLPLSPSSLLFFIALTLLFNCHYPFSRSCHTAAFLLLTQQIANCLFPTPLLPELSLQDNSILKRYSCRLNSNLAISLCFLHTAAYCLFSCPVQPF